MLSHDIDSAEDVAQEAYVRASLRASKYSRDDEGLAYLRRCIVNLCHSQWRHKQVARRVLPRLFMDYHTASHNDPAVFDRQIIIRALRTLPPRQREVVVLRHYVGLSERETAETLGITVGAVKSHASRALTSLRAQMELQNGE